MGPNCSRYTASLAGQPLHKKGWPARLGILHIVALEGSATKEISYTLLRNPQKSIKKSLEVIRLRLQIRPPLLTNCLRLDSWYAAVNGFTKTDGVPRIAK